MNSKVKCMNEAKKYEYNYWDGSRKFGYGGYKYIEGRWTNVAKKLIKIFKLKKSLRYWLWKSFSSIRDKKNITQNRNFRL